MCGCDHDEAGQCHKAQGGAPCGCVCHGRPMPEAAQAAAPPIVHRIQVRAFDTTGQEIYALDAVDPGPPGYLRMSTSHSAPEPGAALTTLSLDTLVVHVRGADDRWIEISNRAFIHRWDWDIG